MSTLIIYYTQVCKITYKLPGSIKDWLNSDVLLDAATLSNCYNANRSLGTFLCWLWFFSCNNRSVVEIFVLHSKFRLMGCRWLF